MTHRIGLSSLVLAALFGKALAGPTGLNVIPTTDLTPLHDWILGVQNGNTSFSGVPFFRMPSMTAESEYGLEPWVEAGFDYLETPDIGHNEVVGNVKALFFSEDEVRPNFAGGVMNVALGQAPTYYLTLSKTLNYDQEQEERYRAHHRRNRKLLGRRVHVGMMLDGHGILQPFAGTDLQINQSLVFQADWINGAGNSATAGISYVFPDQKTVINPAILFSNQTHCFGLSLSLTRQFGS